MAEMGPVAGPVAAPELAAASPRLSPRARSPRHTPGVSPGASPKASPKFGAKQRMPSTATQDPQPDAKFDRQPVFLIMASGQLEAAEVSCLDCFI